MKNQGITILQIVITIVVMMILGTYAILYSQGTPTEAKLAKIYTEIKEIKSTLIEANSLNNIKKQGDVLNIYEEITIPKVNNVEYQDVIGAGNTKEYYYMDFTSSRKLENVLEVENISNDYLLEADTMNIYLIKGVGIKSGNSETKVYKADDIEKHYNNLLKK